MRDEPVGTERGGPTETEVLSWISDGCIVLDHELRCTRMNRQASALLGVPADSLVGRRLRDVDAGTPGSVFTEFRASAEAAFERQAPRQVEARDDASGRWLALRFYPSLGGVLALLADVTVRKGVEAEAAAELDELRRLVEQAPAFLWVVDPDMRVRRMDGAATLLLQIGSDQLVGRTIDEGMELGHVPPDVQALWREMHHRALRGGVGEYLAHYGGLAVEVRVQPLRDASGQIVGVLGVGIDVTEQERIQTQLRESEELHRLLAEHTNDIIILHDAEGSRPVYVSPSFERLLGRLPDETFAGIHPDDEPAAREAWRRMLAGETAYVTVRHRHADGSWRWLETWGSRVQYRGAPHVMAVSRDITERRALEEQLLQSRKMDAIGRLAGGIAHDFNNLLTVIQGYSDFIIAGSAPGDEHREDAQEIRDAAARAALLTQQLLAFGRKQVRHPRVIDLNAVVEEMSRMLRRLIGEDVELDLRLARDAGAVFADAGQLQQVLMNLAVNARDAMPNGGRLTIETGRLAVERETPAQPAPIAPGEYARLTVRDTGTGMTPDVLARAFDPFFTTKEVGKGTGLGLSTVYGIVTQSSGHLRVDSAPGKGTAFEIVFPHAGDAAAPAATPAVTRLPRGAGTILLVEDDSLVRRLVAGVLERAGYRVIVAASADDALSLAAAHDGPIDLVVTDIVMPGRPGPELVARLEAARPGIRTLYVSGYADDMVARYGVTEERVSFLAKPFSPEELARRVRELLDGPDDQ